MDTTDAYSVHAEAEGGGAAERAYRHIKHGILARTYEGGHLLTEGEVADAIGVSRTPVREAMLRLSTEGLLRLYPKRGALVLPVSAQEIHDVLEARELVETYAATSALAGRVAGLVDILTNTLGAMRAAAAEGDVVRFIEADRAFHHAVVAAGGNEILIRLYDLLRDRQLRMGAALMNDAPSRMDRALAEHEAILTAVRADEPAALRSAVLAHLATLSATVTGER